MNDTTYIVELTRKEALTLVMAIFALSAADPSLKADQFRLYKKLGGLFYSRDDAGPEIRQDGTKL